MRKIKLTQNKFALVDDSDFEWLNKWKWYYCHGYAARRHYLGMINGKNKGKKIYMHKVINNTLDGFETDHRNRNKLDNQRDNLRTVTFSQNRINTGIRKDNTSGYLGVQKNKNSWMARIRVNSKIIYLGTFLNKMTAISARKKAELIYHQI